MMKHFTKPLILLSSVLLFQSGTLRAQSDGAPADPPTSPAVRQIIEGPEVTVTFGPGHAVTAKTLNSVSERVGLRPQQTVDVTVFYGAEQAGETVTVDALDGGRVIVPGQAMVIGRDGTVSFKFQTGATPGIYQVSVRDASTELGVQLWVLDRERPDRNPPVINDRN
jgi:hypothetical protein